MPVLNEKEKVNMMKYDLPLQLKKAIMRLGKQCGIEKIILFGSRARGTNHKLSDIDLAVLGGDVLTFSLLMDEEINTLLSFDVVNLGEKISEKLKAEIETDGIDLYNIGGAGMEKYNVFVNCLAVLERADREEAGRDEIYRMGIIGQFNLTFELAWKALKEVLFEHGVSEVATGSPREIIKVAYGLGWLVDEKVWLDMLKNRNVAIHVYDEERAKAVIDLIFGNYLQALQNLKLELGNRLAVISE